MSLSAQRRVEIAIQLPVAALISRDPPAVISSNLLSSDDQENLIRNGFPARLRYSAELRPASGLAGGAVATASWDIIVAYDPLDKVFRVGRLTRLEGPHSLGSYATFAEVRTLLARPYQPDITPPSATLGGHGRYFYAVTLEVERITENDLAEMRSWLGTAMGPNRGAGGAVFSFIGSLFTRLIGAEKKRYSARSDVFRVDAEEVQSAWPGSATFPAR